jgi:hypothetical protein
MPFTSAPETGGADLGAAWCMATPGVRTARPNARASTTVLGGSRTVLAAKPIDVQQYFKQEVVGPGWGVPPSGSPYASAPTGRRAGVLGRPGSPFSPGFRPCLGLPRVPRLPCLPLVSLVSLLLLLLVLDPRKGHPRRGEARQGVVGQAGPGSSGRLVGPVARPGPTPAEPRA